MKLHNMREDFVLEPHFSFSQLISLVSGIGKKLVQLLPLQPTVENMVHRILKIIRDEYVAGQKVSFHEIILVFFLKLKSMVIYVSG